jgi:hypothetical protein
MILNNSPEYATIPEGGKHMFGNRMKYAFLALAVFALIGYSGCILSPDEEVPLPEVKPSYKPLTDKENIIYNLMQCYKEHNIDRYDELLHPDFVWYNQPGSIPEFNDRPQDVYLTGRMFLAAENKHPKPEVWLDKLELTIVQQGQYWTKIDSLEAAPCDDCWETTRDYYITAVTSGGKMTYIGNDLVQFIAKGVDLNGQRIYQLRRADDMKK